MCRRFVWQWDGQEREAQAILGEIRRKTPRGNFLQECVPGREIPYLFVSKEGKTTAGMGLWGFSYQEGKRIHNARRETVEKKPLFAMLLRENRCIVPAHSFFEWDGKGRRYAFSNEEGNLLYFAGLYRQWGEALEIVILTTRAKGAVGEIHHRMPLTIKEENLRRWLYDTSGAKDLLDEGGLFPKWEKIKEG